MADNLLPCPFCCGEPHVMHCGVGTYMVQCLQCKATTDDGCHDRISANWNRRDFSPMTIAGAFVAAVVSAGWQSMDTAPLDGKHCIIAVQEGAFIYSVQGAFDGKCWNAVHASGVKPLCWMPNVRLPSEFLPAGFRPSTTVAKGGGHG